MARGKPRLLGSSPNTSTGRLIMKRLSTILISTDLGYPADWLLDLSQRANPVTEYLTAVSQAPFRTGFKVDCPRIYDFVLDIRPTAYDLQENAASLLFYLRNLKLKN